MKKLLFGALSLCAFSLVAAPIKVMVLGQNIRPVSPFLQNFKEACQKEGIEIHYELPTPAIDFRKVPLELMKQFHVIYFHGVPEAQPSTKGTAEDAAKFRENLEAFRKAGGGILWTPMFMAPHSDHWNPTVGKRYGMNIVEEEIRDPENFVDLYPQMKKPTYQLTYTTNIVKHPVTEGVRGLLFPRQGEWSWPGTVAMDYSPEWTILLRAMPTAKTVGNKGKSAARPEFTDTIKGSIDSAPALVAIRDGKGKEGNLAVYPFYSAHTIQNFGGPAFHDAMMLNGVEGRPSDGFRLFVNLVRYLAPPAEKAGLGTFLGEKPKRENLVVRTPIDWNTVKVQNPGSLSGESGETTRNRGLIGLSSNYAGGKSSVKEYAEAAKKAKLDFIVFLDDGAKHDTASYEKLNKECEAVTDKTLLVLPGLRLRDSYGMHFFLIAPKHYPNKDLMKAPGVVENYWGMVMKLEGAGIGLYRLDESPYDPYWVMWPFLVMPSFYQDGKINDASWKGTLALQKETHAYAHVGGTFVYSAAEMLDALKLAPVNVIAGGADRNEWLLLLTKRGMPQNYPIYQTSGPEILRWSIRNTQANSYQPGGDRARVELDVKSIAPLRDIQILDAVSGKVVRHYRFNGEKEFSTQFHLSHTNRMVLIPFIVDTEGKTAYGSIQRVEHTANKLYPMTDRLMGMHHANIVDPENDGRFQVQGWLGSPNWTKRRNNAGQYPLAGDQQRLRIFGYDGGKIFSGAADIAPYLLFGKKREPQEFAYMPSHRFASENYVRIDYDGNEEFTTPFKSQLIVSDLPRPTEHSHIVNRVWSVAPRFGAPMAFNIQQQTLEFKKDAKITEYRVLQLRRWQMDLGRMWFIRDAAGHEAKKMAVGSTVFLRKGVLRPGDYVYPANEIGGATGIINLGPRELHFRADARFAEIYLPGGEFKAGDKLEMNYLIFGRDARPELQNNDEWLQKYVDDFGIGREKAAYTFALKQGKPLSVAFGLGAEAVDGGAVFEIGKADLPHDLPLTVKVPAANAVYGHFSGRDKTLLMLEAIDGEVHSAVVTNHGAESAYVGELLRVDNPALRLDAVINGENELLLEIHNISAQKQRGAFTACSMFQAPAPIELAPGKSAILKLKGEFKPYAKK